MAKVLIENDAVDIRVSMLERIMLAERPRKVPLSQIRKVDPHPPLLDMMMHWSDQSGVWLCGVSAYEGHMVPSARNPGNTLAIEMESEDNERIYVEVDDESPAQVAERISRALHGGVEGNEQGEIAMPTTNGAAEKRGTALMQALDVELDELDEQEMRLRDPLMQGSLPPPPMSHSEPAPEMKLSDDHDLSRMGGWLVGLGSLGLLSGGVMLASGALPGLLAVAAGAGCALLGGVALAVVAHHQG